MTKIMKIHKISSDDQSVSGPLVKASYKDNPMSKKAYDAYNNAKQRCQNPKNSSYPTYGGLGIKFLFSHFQEMVDAIGYPKHGGLTLDRIDPKGHYEAKNVRWLSQGLQAANKKSSLTGSGVPLEQLVAHYQAAALKPLARKVSTEAWHRCLSALARGYFKSDDVIWFSENAVDPTVFKAGFELGQVPDVIQGLGHFHMPSLTWPGRAIRMAGGPFGYGEVHDDGTRKVTMVNGTLRSLGLGSLSEIVPKPIVEWLRKDVVGPKPGSVWVGQATQDILKAGGFEGWMLAAAARTRMVEKQTAVFMPVLSVLDTLAECGHSSKWQQVANPILDAPYLFIPDFQLDQGEVSDLQPAQFWTLTNLLQHRRQHGRRTFVGVQNPAKLPKHLATEVLGHLEVRDLGTVALSLGWTSFNQVSSPVAEPPSGGFNFQQMREALGL